MIYRHRFALVGWSGRIRGAIWAAGALSIEERVHEYLTQAALGTGTAILPVPHAYSRRELRCVVHAPRKMPLDVTTALASIAGGSISRKNDIAGPVPDRCKAIGIKRHLRQSILESGCVSWPLHSSRDPRSTVTSNRQDLG